MTDDANVVQFLFPVTVAVIDSKPPVGTIKNP